MTVRRKRYGARLLLTRHNPPLPPDLLHSRSALYRRISVCGLPFDAHLLPSRHLLRTYRQHQAALSRCALPPLSLIVPISNTLYHAGGVYQLIVLWLSPLSRTLCLRRTDAMPDNLLLLRERTVVVNDRR